MTPRVIGAGSAVLAARTTADRTKAPSPSGFETGGPDAGAGAILGPFCEPELATRCPDSGFACPGAARDPAACCGGAIGCGRTTRGATTTLANSATSDGGKVGTGTAVISETCPVDPALITCSCGADPVALTCSCSVLPAGRSKFGNLAVTTWSPILSVVRPAELFATTTASSTSPIFSTSASVSATRAAATACDAFGTIGFATAIREPCRIRVYGRLPRRDERSQAMDFGEIGVRPGTRTPDPAIKSRLLY